MPNKPLWLSSMKDSIVEQCIRLILLSYSEISAVKKATPPLENQRRNELYNVMLRNKTALNLFMFITIESGVTNEDNEDVGRMDIAFYDFPPDEGKAITFECKRFFKKDMTSSHFKAQYCKEGIVRFADGKYSAGVSEAGMIAFVETGDYMKAYRLFQNELPSKTAVRELSDKYGHQYIFQTVHSRKTNNDITLTHILMNFT